MENAFGPCSSQRIAPRIERRIVEKNRRIEMKNLCSQLVSLLPDDSTTSKERLTVADKIGEAGEYIKSMKLKLENMKQKKESLSRRKRSRLPVAGHRLPLLEVQEMGPNLDVVIANEIEGYSMFRGLVNLLHQHGFEIANANFSIHGNSTVQVLHDTVAGTSKLSARRMKEMICETSDCVT